MEWETADWENVASAAQSIATIMSFIVAGIWVYLKYIRQQERYANIESSADVKLIGVQDGFWIAELIATLHNKGKVQHRMYEFRFDLSAIGKGAAVEINPEWGGQVDFPMAVKKGSFLPERYKFFYVDPGIKAKYSYVTLIPVSASFVNLHWWFLYGDNRQFKHVAERTIALPVVDKPVSADSATTS